MSEIKAKKKKSSFKKQRIALIALAVTLLLLGVGLFAVVQVVINLPKDFIDPNDGTLYHIKKSDGEFALFYTDGKMCEQTEDGYYKTLYGTLVYINKSTGEYSIDQNREMIFNQLFYDAYDAKGNTSYPDNKIINKLTVENIHGTYAFVRDELDTFILEGYPEVTYTQEAFTKLMMACAFPLSVMKLESPKTLPDGSVDYAEYGLISEIREREEADEDGNIIKTEYEYFPTKATMSMKSGEEYILYFGDETVSAGAFYAKSADKSDVYILSGDGIANYLTQKVEAVISPSLVHSMTSVDYVHVKDFILFDHKQNKKLCHFTYQDLEERQNSIYANIPFISYLDYSDGYYINSTSVTQMLQQLYETNFAGTEKLDPTDEDLAKYGLDKPETTISYTYYFANEKGEREYVDNKFIISAQNPDGTYYAYSETYDMIVCVNEVSFDFLAWNELEWYNPNFMQFNINHVTDITIQGGGTNIHFNLDNSLTLDGNFFPIVDNKFIDTNENEYAIKPEGGKYLLTANNSEMTPVYNNDLLITGVPYVQGTPESDSYLLSEIIQLDLDGDGQNDTRACLYYDKTRQDGKFVLYTTLVVIDDSGNPIGEPQRVICDAAYSTDFLITTGYSDYLFFMPRDSEMAKELSRKYYGAEGEGWYSADIYATSDGKYLLLNVNTGAWATIATVSNSIYVADKDLSKLDAGGVVVNGEVYYTNTGKELSYNSATGKFELYDRANDTRTEAQYKDIFPGIWSNGDFYVSKTGDLLIIDPKTGDAGRIQFPSSIKYLASVFANGKELNYTYSTTDTLGNTENHVALYNFQQFYTAILFGSFEGMCDIGDEEMASLRELDDFSGADPVCIMKMTINIKDMKGNTVNLVYRFYRITERRAYVTIESLDSPDASSSSQNAYGGFYILASYAEKLLSDAGKVVSGTPVSPNSKY